jgi:hypothetical protein
MELKGDSTMDDAEEREEEGQNRSGPPDGRRPAAWVSTEVLECEIWNAIAEDFSQPFDSAAEYDDDEDPLPLEDEFADEVELRNSLFRQLSDLRPELGELLSGPRPSAEGES